MTELFQSAYYGLDLVLGFGAPVVTYGLVRTGRVDRVIWRLFWLGCLLGLLWEVPIFVLSAESTSLPLITWVRPPPVPYPVLLVSHTLWDGGLFLVGVWLVHRLCPSPVFARFSFRELAVLWIFGQVSALAVELSSVLNDGWVYLSCYAWNPPLFHVHGHPLTLLPQLVWAVAPVVFYGIALRVYAGRAS